MLEIRNLRKAFGDLQVLKGIDLDVNKGDVVEAGSHEELLKRRGFYWTLYNSQFAPTEG